MSTVRTKTPIRVDLAGGTVDIWPIYLILESPSTINLGINIYANARFAKKDNEKGNFKLISKDLGEDKTLSLKELERKDTYERLPGSLRLHYLVLNFFREKHPEFFVGSFELESHATGPAGSGLGGSSCLAFGMAAAIYSAIHQKTKLDEAEKQRIIFWIRDIEASILGAPAGFQDQFGGAFGGLQQLHWKPGEPARTLFSREITEGLGHRLLVFYSGKSRNSGMNNWALFKDCIDGVSETWKSFQDICDITNSLHSALLDQDWNTVGTLIDSEWKIRKGLAPEITTPEIESFIKASREKGVGAAKICGAGGGGCFFLYFPDDNATERDQQMKLVKSLAQDYRFEALDFEVDFSGVHIEIER